MAIEMKISVIAVVISLGILLIPIIAIAQAVSYGWNHMFNTAYMGMQNAMRGYGMQAPMHGAGGMMNWGSNYMGQMTTMCVMMSTNYSQVRITGVLLVTDEIEEMEHMTILINNIGEQYALILPADEWMIIMPNGTRSIIDLDELRVRLNSTIVDIEGINIGSMSEMCNMMGCNMMGAMGSMGQGMPMCHAGPGYSTQQSGAMMPMMGQMSGHMMGRHMGMGSNSGEEEEHHMETCMRLMNLPHVVVNKIFYNGYIITPYE
jgi:hypothetical protein